MKFSQLSWAPFSSSQWRTDKKLAQFQEEVRLGREEVPLRRRRKSVMITVTCRTAYLSWAFLVICCPCWLGSFIKRNYLQCSPGFIFVHLFFGGFIFRESLRLLKIKSVKNLTRENLHIYSIFSGCVCVCVCVCTLLSYRVNNASIGYRWQRTCYFLAFHGGILGHHILVHVLHGGRGKWAGKNKQPSLRRHFKHVHRETPITCKACLQLALGRNQYLLDLL